MKIHIFTGILIVIYSMGCSQIQSHISHPSTVFVDGSLSEWSNDLIVPDGSKVAVGIKHDDKNIYIAIRLIDRITVMQAVARGLIIWFDPNGKKKRHLGIHYPLHNKNRPPIMLGMGHSQANPEEFEYRIKSQLEDQYLFEYLENNSKSIQQIGLDNDLGIQIKTQYQNGEFSYELQIPHEIITENFNLEKQISIGITTPEMNREEMKMRSRSDGAMGGQRPSGGGMRGGGMGRGGGKGVPGGRPSGMQRPEPIDLWFKIQFDTK